MDYGDCKFCGNFIKVNELHLHGITRCISTMQWLGVTHDEIEPEESTSGNPNFSQTGPLEA